MNYYRLTGKEKRIGGWDLIWDDGAIVADDTMDCAPTNGSSVSTPNSYLGLLLRGYYMAIIISHPILARGPMARGLIWVSRVDMGCDMKIAI